MNRSRELAMTLVFTLLVAATSQAQVADLLESPQAPAVLAVPDTGARRGFDPDADAHHLGIDDAGWFHANTSAQEVCPDHILILLEDLDYAEAVLNRGRVTALTSLETNHILFRATFALAEPDAQALGVSEIEVAVKPSSEGGYGWEYKRELIFYALGRHLQTQGLVPIVERDVDFAPVAESTLSQLTSSQQTRLFVFENDDGDRWLHGSVQLWVEGYANRVGRRQTSLERLQALSAALEPSGSDPVTTDPLWQSLSDMYVMDYLVGNSDRAYELGSVRLPDGGQRLILLDNGDALLGYNPNPEGTPPSETLFMAVRMFSPNVVRALDELTADVLRDVWVGVDGSPLVTDRQIDRVMNRVETALDHIHGLPDGSLFERDTPPML